MRGDMDWPHIMAEAEAKADPVVFACSMTLRDYIAIHAGPHVLFSGFKEVTNGSFARLAYQFADTMLEARKRPHES